VARRSARRQPAKDLSKLKSTAEPVPRTAPRLLLAVVMLGLAITAWMRLGGEWRRGQPLRRHLYAGVEFARRGMGAQAESEWKAALRLDPNYTNAYRLLAEYYLSARHWQKARDALQRLRKLAPQDEHLACRLAACALNMGDEVSAYQEAETEIHQHDPNCVAALATSAVLLSRMGEKPRAVTYYRRLGRLQPDDPVLQYLLAEVLSDTFAYREARPVLEHVIKLDPNQADAYALLGRGWIDDTSAPDHVQRAEQAFRKALELNPLNSEARLAYGRLLLRASRPREAIVQLEEATRLMPNATEAAYDLTRAYDLAGQPAQAAAARRRFLGLRQIASRVQALEKRASVSPTNFDYPYELGTLELGRGNYRRAYVWLNKALVLRPADRRVASALDDLSRRSTGPSRMAAVQERITGASMQPAGQANGAGEASPQTPPSHLPAPTPGR
jgi:tetratricopeptide (TPR) repeat protein